MKILDIPQSGSVAAVTSSRNRSGQYRRSRAIPTQPRTASQLAARSRLSTQAAAWRGLTDAQRSSWVAFAGSFTVINTLGQSIHLTGSQAYVKVNSVLDLLGDSALTTPPSLPSFTATAITGFTAAAGTPAFDIAGSDPDAGTRYMVYASAQKSAGVSYNSDFRYIGVIENGDTMPDDKLTEYTARHGSLVAGKKIFLKVVQEQSGMQDSGTLYTAIVGA